MERTREDLRAAMGELPEVSGPVGEKRLRVEERESFFIERLVLDLNGYEPVPAIFVRPKKGTAPRPAVLFNHSHGNLFQIGKRELLDGCEYMLPRGYAYDLAERGIASLSIDQMCFEERRGRTESAAYKELIWDGHYMWAWMVFDSLRALDYLCAREDVDAGRIGTVGMSMGSSMAQWVSALDERIRACVDICCLTNYDELAAERRFDEHGIYYYIPGLRRKFTTSQLNALIAPRPHLSFIGRYDNLTPQRGVDRDEREIREVYEALGAGENWTLLRYPVGHVETEEMRADALRFFERWLL
ncbi:MAG: alpha/beta hydrolase [Clostridiales bacterium]|jgi:hypothetical protein|nr:alpha/beta hydrolase [Clostridiales bacterium]